MEAQRLDEAVDDPLSNNADYDNDADYDADASRVQAAVNANPLAFEEGEEEEMAVPTEYLQEDLGMKIELSGRFRPGRLSRFIAHEPAKMISMIAALAAILTLWVLVGASDRFSVEETLFRPTDDVDVLRFVQMSHDLPFSARSQLGGHRSLYTDPAVAADRASITLVFEKRGSSASDVLGLRELKAIHDIESELHAWASDSETKPCYQAADGSCVPMDSLNSWLYPTVSPGAQLSFDGGMEGGGAAWSCAVPPFGASDVAQTARWLQSTGRDGVIAREGADTDSADAAHSPYLRATLYLDTDKMDAGRWYELALLLWRRSSSWLSQSSFVKVWYGGPTDLTLAELLVALTNDMWLLGVALLAVLLYMRLFFGVWKLALLAALQILISLPLMYWLVTVLFGQAKLSAFAGASLWVVVGVSADNIFVLTETWGQSKQLLRDGRPADMPDRLSWTVRQAGVPLFYANATTAASLFINCFSSLPAIFQFGLCGGILLFVNMALGLTYLPALLVLQERGAFDRSASGGQAARDEELRKRMLALQAIHRSLWRQRTRVLTWFGVLVLLLLPTAVSLSPGADASFTFSPDPAMTRVVQLARLAPPDGLFRAADGEHGIQGVNGEVGTPLLMNASASAAGVPERYRQLLAGTYVPPPPPRDATFFAIVLSALVLYDAALLALLARAIAADGPVHFLQPPPGGRRYQALICLAAAMGLAVLALCTFFLALLLCDFAVVFFLLLGNALGLLLLAHAALCLKLSRIAHDGGEWGCLRASQWMTDDRSAPQLLLGGAALLALLGVIVLIITDSSPPGPSLGWGWLGFGWSYGPSGLALLLAFLLLWDGAVGLRAAQFAFDGYSPDDAPLRSLPEQRFALLGGGAALVLVGWVLLLLSGLPVADGFSMVALCNATGVVCLGNALGHAALGVCYRRKRPMLLFKPTQWATAHRTEALGMQGLLAAAWTCAAIVSFTSVALAGPCDYNNDHSTSLGELGTCFGAAMKSMGVEGVPLPSWGMVALGLTLALLWQFDAVVANLGCRVLRSGEQIACLAPLERASGSREASRALYARLRLARALLTALALALFGVALAPAGFAVVFGPRGIGAYNLLALTLLAHVPALSALFRVLITHERLHMLAPTAWSEHSKVPALLTLLADVFCLVAGLTIIFTRDTFALPPLATSDWHGLLLAVILTLDSHLLLAAARAQFEHTPDQPAEHVLLFIRPLSGATAGELDELGDSLADAGGCCAAAGACVAWLSLFPAAAAALFSSVRVLSVAMELLLCLHALLAFFLVHLVHADKGVWIFAPPPQLDDERGTVWMRRLFGGGVAPLGLAFLLPLVDGGFVWEAFGNLVFSVLVAGAAVTHGLYSGELEMPFDLPAPPPRVAFLGTSAAAVLCGICYALAISPAHSMLLANTGFFLPVPYMLVSIAWFFALINIPPLAMVTEVWYTGRTVCGFDADDAPRDRHGQTVGAGRLLLATLATCVAFGAMWATTSLIVVLETSAHASGDLPQTSNYRNVERCRIYWGLDFAPYEDDTQIATLRTDLGGFHPEQPAAQEELLRACDAVHSSPLSPLHKQAADHSADHPCVMRELHNWVVGSAGGPADAWPIPPEQFATRMADFLRAKPDLQPYVGFADSSLAKVAWILQSELPAQFAAAESIELLANPGLLAAYRASWDAYLASLPEYVRSSHAATQTAATGATTGASTVPTLLENATNTSTPSSPPSPPPPSPSPPPSVDLLSADTSALRFGVHVCSKWSVLAVEKAFFSSVQRALTFTPLFSMGAIALFSRSLIIAYASLYSLLGMLLALLGTMHVLGVPLGITAALALALVLGMSVDYIIHLAHAYKNSMFSDRYHKSRAAIFARGQSIASAAITTLGAVMPLLWAQLLPLRQFGTVFALVTVISLAFAFFFLAILMVIGPLRTRAGARAPGPAAAQRPHAAETERVGMISGLTTLQRPTPSNHKYQHDEAGAQVDPNPGRSRQSEDDEDEEML